MPVISAPGQSESLRTLIVLLVGTVLTGALSGCDVLEPKPFEPEVVVESYQVAGESLNPVRLTWSVPVHEQFDYDEHGIAGATVRVLLLDENGGIAEVYSYVTSDRSPSVYVAEEAATVLPGRTYRLEVEVQEREGTITAETTVPDTFEVVEGAETMIYEDPDEAVVVSGSSRAAPGYVFTITAQEVRSDRLTPAFQTYLDQHGEEALTDLETTMSSVIDRAEQREIGQNLVEMAFPWEAVPFYGPNRVEVAAIDKNYDDFLRSQAVQQGGMGFSPGEIPSVIVHVDGGEGLFGSYAKAEFETSIQAAEETP